MNKLIPIEKIDRAILMLRGSKVMLDADLAMLYGVKRNKDRFPDDFMFQLNDMEKSEVIANCDHLKKLKFSRTNPYAFSEHGAIMLASVLNTPTAVKISVQIVRAFVRLRELMATHTVLAEKISELEQKYDGQFNNVFSILKELMHQNSKIEERPKIGFKQNENKK